MMMIEKLAPSLIGGISRTEHIMPASRLEVEQAARRRHATATPVARGECTAPGTLPTITRVELPFGGN
jgi:hypothetical protein